MAVYEYFSASGLIGQTTWSLTSNSSSIHYPNTSGIYCAIINLSGMKPGDEYTFKHLIQSSTVLGSLIFPAYTAIFNGSQNNPIFISPPIFSQLLWEMTMTGSGVDSRNFFWSIRRCAN